MRVDKSLERLPQPLGAQPWQGGQEPLTDLPVGSRRDCTQVGGAKDYLLAELLRAALLVCSFDRFPSRRGWSRTFEQHGSGRHRLHLRLVR